MFKTSILKLNVSRSSLNFVIWGEDLVQNGRLTFLIDSRNVLNFEKG